jgi:hypothetical protein
LTRAGGQINWTHSAGDTVTGEFIELVADRKVVFSFGWEWADIGIPPRSTTIEIDGGIAFVVEDTSDDGSTSGVAASPATEDRPVMIPREVRPPLRRWAAARLVRRDPPSWPPILRRSGELDARGAAAVMRGLLDAIGSLPEPAQSLICRRAAGWPQLDVRKAAGTLAARAPRSATKPRPTQRATNGDLRAPGAHRRALSRPDCLF